ncbi:hypothetical protein [Sphingomonas sp. G-3-2-10]|jgi:hypothetical protein|uniref:hypothetical protein n=1 Tax=Sphingomonas sp. G-3-2-10 TaxID=2728838 RepID=UPI00146F30F3|nr:hypothetical protein [Sphingomonas sp. G-3-2-10]NML06085.1 hypothetical protein [Sphingomonas sp. G-3-2-10]
MSAEIFIRRWLGLFAMLAGLIVFAPFLFQAVIGNSGCGATSGACTRLGTALELYGLWVVLAIVLIPLAVAIAARALTAGMFAFAFPFGLIMIAGSIPLFFALGNFQDPAFLDNLVALRAVMPLLFLFVLLVALSVAGDEDEGASGAWKMVLGFAALAAAFVSAPDWLPGLEAIPYLGHIAAPLSWYLARAHGALGIVEVLPQLTNHALIGFILATAGLMFSRGRETVTVRKRSYA